MGRISAKAYSKSQVAGLQRGKVGQYGHDRIDQEEAEGKTLGEMELQEADCLMS